ncbi:MAG: sugar transferase, partial [Chthoniobacterales bacterium]|nr:sugar transferase [Chthoniobacterales bacterium]
VINIDFLREIPPFRESLWMMILLMVFGPVALGMQGFYRPVFQNKLGTRVSQLVRAGVVVMLAMGLCVIFFRVYVPSRSVLVMEMVLGPLCLLVRDIVSESLYVQFVRKGDLRERILLAGEREAMKEFWEGLPQGIRHEMNLVQRIDLEKEGMETFLDALHRHAVGRVILCFHKMQVDRMQEAISACETEGVEAWLSANFVRTSVARPTYDFMSGHPMLVFRATPELSWSLFGKEVLDRIMAFLLLILLSPLFLVIAVAIKMTSRGPIFFRQVRSGLHGKKFVMLKFRSMYEGADRMREQLLEKNEMSGPVFKLTNDPRVTPLGSFLRRTSLDELPQLWNILKGEMSFVGPRPLPDYEVEKFDKLSHRRRLSMKPGLTCLWQISGRNEVKDFEEWVRMDLEYIDNWSLVLDLWILLRTIPIVLLGKGAK